MGMHERARQLGGQLSIFSQLGQGTCITLQVPLPQANDEALELNA